MGAGPSCLFVGIFCCSLLYQRVLYSIKIVAPVKGLNIGFITIAQWDMPVKLIFFKITCLKKICRVELNEHVFKKTWYSINGRNNTFRITIMIDSK